MIFEPTKEESFECFLNWISEYNTEYEVVVDWWDVADDIPYTECVTCLVECGWFVVWVVAIGEVAF